MEYRDYVYFVCLGAIILILLFIAADTTPMAQQNNLEAVLSTQTYQTYGN